jgi:hypothetical protein
MEPVITAFTLIDITATGIIKGESRTRDQQRNWETVLQVLGLKTQPIIINYPGIWTNENLNDFEFGDFYEGYQTIWAWQFRGERDEFYSLEILEQDFDQVPIILGLEETARFMLPVFFTHGHLKNIYFKQLNIKL